MSTRKGGVKKGPPKHQNTVAWKPNRAVKKKESELGSKQRPYSKISNVCSHCYEQIEWKRKYGKYKPITEPSKCIHCSKRNVKQAYHKLCENCAKAENICAKCCKPSSNIIIDEQQTEEEEKKKLEEAIMSMRERERRTILREMAKGSKPNMVEIGEARIKGKKNEEEEDDEEEDDEDDDDEGLSVGDSEDDDESDSNKNTAFEDGCSEDDGKNKAKGGVESGTVSNAVQNQNTNF